MQYTAAEHTVNTGNVLYPSYIWHKNQTVKSIQNLASKNL